MSQLLSYKVRRRYSDGTLEVKPWNVFINWGSSTTIPTGGNRVVNPVERIALASDKLRTFQALENVAGIRIPAFTTDRSVATGWLRDGVVVVCRTVLSGHSGAGIVLAQSEDQLVNAPLYVQYVKKAKEFRCHVAFGEVIDVQEKRKRAGYEGATNFQVRNHHTGWVYCREDIQEPTGLKPMALQVVSTLGLDFGAVDIIYNAKRNELYVLEVNTAPGIENTTVEKYATAFVRALTS
jgi:glutathione synthase/RimK-type ligase-like ATP-grasp enzyme